MPYIKILFFFCFGSLVVAQHDDSERILGKMLSRADRLLSFKKSNPRRTLDKVGRRLQARFDRELAQPKLYHRKGLRECSMFPEGRIYPFAIPALAYGNLALKNPEHKDRYLPQMARLIDLLIIEVTREVRPPGGKLENLDDYGKQGTYLATLNIAIGSYVLAGGDERYRKIHDRVSDLLYLALVAENGGPIASYPAYSWNFDTIMALVSLDLHDRVRGTDRTAPVLEKHLKWVERQAVHKETGLPYSQGWDGDRLQPVLPRGCDLSMQICLLQQVAPQTARKRYRDYIAAHWIDRGFVAGFAEWPRSTMRSFTGDFDSGPVLFGIGLTGTGVGVGTALAMNDAKRLRRLCRGLELVNMLRKPILALGKQGKFMRWFDSLVSPNAEYFTGFLYGDAVLFYAVTWVPYPRKGG